jgi:hypothetical protein
MIMANDTLLDLVELGRKVGVSRNSLLRLCKSGQLEHVNDDGVVKSSEAKFNRYVASNNGRRPR